MNKCHVVALPFPGRGHINPMLNLCKILVSRTPNIHVTFVVTEEWLTLIASHSNPHNSIQFRSIPNVIPSENGRAKNFPGFLQAVLTKMEPHFQSLLDDLNPTLLLTDVYLGWALHVGIRRKIPVASMWPMSASMFTILHHFDLLIQNRHYPFVPEMSESRVDYVAGISSIRLADLPSMPADGRNTMNIAQKCVRDASQAQCILLTSVYELEPKAVEAIKSQFEIPVYTLGPLIPYFDHKANPTPDSLSTTQWLDSHPKRSVLYISLGSFLSISEAQMYEIGAGLRDSGVPHIWVVRADITCRDLDTGDLGLVVPWCDQLTVLTHQSVGLFWTHCGWNSILEAAFTGVPMLTCPIFWDQRPNSKLIVEDWKAGLSVIEGTEKFVGREVIARIVRSAMDSESQEGREMRCQADRLRELCRSAVEKGGSSDANFNAFVSHISGHSQFVQP